MTLAPAPLTIGVRGGMETTAADIGTDSEPTEVADAARVTPLPTPPLPTLPLPTFCSILIPLPPPLPPLPAPLAIEEELMCINS